VQLTATTTVSFFFPVCTVHLEIEHKSYGFARNPTEFQCFVILTLPRRVRKINWSKEVRKSKFDVLRH